MTRSTTTTTTETARWHVAVVAVLGASGVLGGRVAAAAVARGHTVVRPAAPPDGDPPAETLADPRGVPLDDALDDALADTLGDALGDTERGGGPVVVVDATSAMGQVRRETVRRIVDRGWTLVDLSLDPSHLAWVAGRADGGTSLQPGRVVLGAGLLGLAGDLLAALAAPASGTPGTVHVAYALPDRVGLRGAATPGLWRAIAGWLTASGTSGAGEAELAELVGERRRLAWFPRPVGPVHAAGIPAPEAWTVPLHLDVPSAATSLALPSWRAERLQAAANASGWPLVGPWIVERVGRSRPEPGPTVRATTRWACVAEVEGSAGVARAWAYGHDPLGTAVAGLMAVLDRLTDADVVAGLPTGVLAPAQLGAPGPLLDAISVATDLRWSITRP